MLTPREIKNFLLSFVLSGALLLFGGALNQVAIAFNSGLMPVEFKNCPAGYLINTEHNCAGPESHLRFLDDWIYYDDIIYSPGDIGMMLGQAGTVFTLMSLLGFGIVRGFKNRRMRC